MSDADLPAGAEGAYLRALRAADETGIRYDEDYIGLPLAAPFDRAVPGLAIPLFPTAGRVPGGPNLVYPVRLVIRVALASADLRFDPVTVPPVTPDGPDGSLGDLNDLASLSIADRQRLRAEYIAMLDTAAAAATSPGDAASGNGRERTRNLFERLREKALAATYAALAPAFMRWLYGA
jgi:hypothetical protein